MRSGSLILLLTAAIFAAGCGGGGSTQTTPQPTPTPAPTTVPIASGGTLTARGSRGVIFTFTLGSGVPSGESATISAYQFPPPCTGTGCTAVEQPVDAINISVAPQPLAVASVTSLGLTGVPTSTNVEPFLNDLSDAGAFTNFAIVPPSGGTLRVVDPGSSRPVTTLAPNHLYGFGLFPSNLPPQ